MSSFGITKSRALSQVNEVREAIESALDSYRQGDLDGWEIALIRGRLDALEMCIKNMAEQNEERKH